MKAPKNAPSGKKARCCGNKIMMTIATRPAPDETPIIPGSARGFLITPCSSVPDAAKHVPTINPTRTLGMRRSHTIR